MKTEELIKEYVGEILKEGYFQRGVRRHHMTTDKDVVQKIKRFFAPKRSAKSIAKDWIDSQRKYSDFSSELEEKIFQFADKKYNMYLDKTDDDRLAARYTARALEDRFGINDNI